MTDIKTYHGSTHLTGRQNQIRVVAAMVVGSLAVSGQRAVAQIVPDATLGNERSILTPNVVVNGALGDLIDGGALRGNNLFHSFLDFNVANGQRVYFADAPGIANILTRVTGTNPSNLLGQLGTTGGTANLFLINPNGIIFGANARLDVRGSFIATTANAVPFDNQGSFSASNPTAPLLLTINPSALVFNLLTSPPSAIVNRSTVGLQVPNGKSLLLVGGAINLENGILRAPGGRVELGALAAPANVGLALANDLWSLSVPTGVSRADIAFTGSGQADVRSGGGGSIALTGNNITLNTPNASTAGNSNLGSNPLALAAGILDNSGFIGAQAGDITIDASGDVAVGAGRIFNFVYPSGIGNGGNVLIRARSFTLQNRGGIDVSTAGRGNAGRVELIAPGSILFDGQDSSITNNVFLQPGVTGFTSGGVTVVGETFSLLNRAQITTRAFGGNAGDILISVETFNATRRGRLVASTFGAGDGGDITINARDAINLEGIIGQGGDRGGIFSNVESGANGNGGNIRLITGDLSITNWAVLSTALVGRGRAGDITIHASGDVLLADDISGTNSSANISSDLRAGSVGEGGDISLTAQTLTIRNGAGIRVPINARNGNRPDARGNSGDVVIQVSGAVVFEGGNSGITNAVFGGEPQNQAGDVILTADSLTLSNGAQITGRNFGRAKAGNIILNVRDLTLVNGSRLVESTFANVNSSVVTGDAGNITINASGTVWLDGIGLNNNDRTSIVTEVEPGSGGQGGDIDITARSLLVTNGAVISASTRGAGDAGNIRIHASDSVILSRNNDFSGYNPNAPRATSTNVFGTALSTSTDPTQLRTNNPTAPGGRGGNIEVVTGTLQIEQGAVIEATTRGGQTGGQITLTVNDLNMSSGGQVLTTAFDSGNAGSITIDAANLVTLSGVDPNYATRLAFLPVFGQSGFPLRALGLPSSPETGLFANTAPGSTGNSGSITIDPPTVTLRDYAQIAVDSQGSGQGGNIQIEADSLSLDNHAQISARTLAGQGSDVGNITLTLQDLLLLRRNSLVSTDIGTLNSGGDGGNIAITTPFLVAVPIENSDITANAFTGRGGSVTIAAQGIFGIEFRPQATVFSDITASSEFGAPGVVDITTPGIDPSQGLVALPANLADSSGLIAQGCSSAIADGVSQFTTTGRGGVPPSPLQSLTAEEVLSSWVGLPPTPPATPRPRHSDLADFEATSPLLSAASAAPPEIVEAQQWVVNRDRQVTLVAQNVRGSKDNWLTRSPSFWSMGRTCQASR